MLCCRYYPKFFGYMLCCGCYPTFVCTNTNLKCYQLQTVHTVHKMLPSPDCSYCKMLPSPDCWHSNILPHADCLHCKILTSANCYFPVKKSCTLTFSKNNNFTILKIIRLERNYLNKRNRSFIFFNIILIMEFLIYIQRKQRKWI